MLLLCDPASMPKRVFLNMPLTPEEAAFVAATVGSGRYGSARRLSGRPLICGRSLGTLARDKR